MTSYRVRWEIDVDATDPREAAQVARVAQVRLGTNATCFTVFDNDEASPDYPLSYGEDVDLGAAS